jgi:hypothetical protein
MSEYDGRARTDVWGRFVQPSSDEGAEEMVSFNCRHRKEELRTGRHLHYLRLANPLWDASAGKGTSLWLVPNTGCEIVAVGIRIFCLVI